MPAYAAVLDIPVSSTNDDAEETLATGSVYLNSDDLEMVDNAGDLQAVGGALCRDDDPSRGQ